MSKESNPTTKKKKSSKNTKQNKKKTSNKKEFSESNKIQPGEKINLESLKREVDMLFRITKGLQNKFQTMSGTINSLNDSVDNLTKIIKLNEKFVEKMIEANKIEGKEINENTEISKEDVIPQNGINVPIEARQQIEDQDFVPKIREIIGSLRETQPDKEYFQIKTVKKLFQEKFIISNEKFEELLIEGHWNRDIELLPGTGEAEIKDHYGNIYQNISSKPV